MCLPRSRLATRLFSRAFSSSSCRNFRGSLTIPEVELRLADTHLPADIGHQRPALRLAKHIRNLFFRKLRQLYWDVSPCDLSRAGTAMLLYSRLICEFGGDVNSLQTTDKHLIIRTTGPSPFARSFAPRMAPAEGQTRP